jgi:hypothetical protein
MQYLFQIFSRYLNGVNNYIISNYKHLINLRTLFLLFLKSLLSKDHQSHFDSRNPYMTKDLLYFLREIAPFLND